MARRKNKNNNKKTKQIHPVITEITFNKLKEYSDNRHLSMGQFIDCLVKGENNIDGWISSINQNIAHIVNKLDDMDKKSKRWWFS
jgi:hypothetical protein